ncbi:Sec27 [Kluyveromyces lactis]|nr:Sec27 [Kluyveromyces lactis]
MKLDINKKLSARTDRVKGIDFHPEEPWVLITLYSGRIEIWNYETQTQVRSIPLCDAPVRAGRFIARKNWVVVGSDDFKLRVYNYNTGEKVTEFEAHPDYIRSIAVHPTKPFVLTGSDDLTIKLWNWEKNWGCQQTFTGHEHFVMSVAFNPKDPNQFASGCLDHTIKVWSIGQDVPNFTLKAHETKGVNYVDYYPLQDKPYLITTSDDGTIKVWDYQTKSNVATLEGHMANVSYAVFHPTLPIIISGSEDGTLKIWNANTYKLEKTLNIGLERSWCIATHPSGKRNYIASGFDNGFTVLSLGDDQPKLSLDPVGKLVYCGGKASATDVFSAIIRGNEEVEEGGALPLQSKELGSIDVFPQSLKHSPNGRFVTVVGDDEFIVYTALAWRNKAFGKCHDFAWGPDSNSYALITGTGAVTYYKNFKQVSSWSIPLDYGVEKIFPGSVLGVKADGFVYFFDWESGNLVKRIDVDAKDIIWSDNGELVMVINKDHETDSAEEANAYALLFNKDVYDEAVSAGSIDEDGVEDAFDVLYEVSEGITSGKWVGDVFIFTTPTNRLNYFVGGKIYNLAHFDKQMYLLGYLPRDDKVYLADKDIHVYGYELSIDVLEFETLVLRGELAEAKSSVLPNVQGKENLLKISRFLEGQDLFEDALEISPDAEQKFDLAIKLGRLSLAQEILSEQESENRWIQLGDAALKKFNFTLALQCYEKANDLESLFLLYSSFNNREELVSLAKNAETSGKFNLAFNAYWVAGDIAGAKDLLLKSNRVPEAALLSLTYGESEESINNVVDVWKQTLTNDGKAAIAERVGVVGKTEGFPSTNTHTLLDLDTPSKSIKEAAPVNRKSEEDVAVEEKALDTEGNKDGDEDEEAFKDSSEEPQGLKDDDKPAAKAE